MVPLHLHEAVKADREMGSRGPIDMKAAGLPSLNYHHDRFTKKQGKMLCSAMVDSVHGGAPASIEHSLDESVQLVSFGEEHRSAQVPFVAAPSKEDAQRTLPQIVGGAQHASSSPQKHYRNESQTQRQNSRRGKGLHDIFPTVPKSTKASSWGGGSGGQSHSLQARDRRYQRKENNLTQPVHKSKANSIFDGGVCCGKSEVNYVYGSMAGPSANNLIVPSDGTADQQPSIYSNRQNKELKVHIRQSYSQVGQQGAAGGLRGFGVSQKIDINRNRKDRVQNCMEMIAQQPSREAQYKSARVRNPQSQKMHAAIKHAKMVNSAKTSDKVPQYQFSSWRGHEHEKMLQQYAMQPASGNGSQAELKHAMNAQMHRTQETLTGNPSKAFSPPKPMQKTFHQETRKERQQFCIPVQTFPQEGWQGDFLYKQHHAFGATIRSNASATVSAKSPQPATDEAGSLQNGSSSLNSNGEKQKSPQGDLPNVIVVNQQRQSSSEKIGRRLAHNSAGLSGSPLQEAHTSINPEELASPKTGSAVASKEYAMHLHTSQMTEENISKQIAAMQRDKQARQVHFAQRIGKSKPTKVAHTFESPQVSASKRDSDDFARLPFQTSDKRGAAGVVLSAKTKEVRITNTEVKPSVDTLVSMNPDDYPLKKPQMAHYPKIAVPANTKEKEGGKVSLKQPSASSDRKIAPSSRFVNSLRQDEGDPPVEAFDLTTESVTELKILAKDSPRQTNQARPLKLSMSQIKQNSSRASARKSTRVVSARHIVFSNENSHRCQQTPSKEEPVVSPEKPQVHAQSYVPLFKSPQKAQKLNQNLSQSQLGQASSRVEVINTAMARQQSAVTHLKIAENCQEIVRIIPQQSKFQSQTRRGQTLDDYAGNEGQPDWQEEIPSIIDCSENAQSQIPGGHNKFEGSGRDISASGRFSVDSEGPKFDMTGHIDVDQQRQLELQSVQRGERLGGGSFGTVYQGLYVGEHFRDSSSRGSGEEKIRLPAQLAIKVIKVEDTELQGRMETNWELMRQLKHDNIVQYYGCLIDKKAKEASIFMELVPKTLQTQYRSHGPLNERLIRKHTRQILEALDYLHNHELRVIHGDLKAANIMFNGKFVKLADFGESRFLSPLATDFQQNSQESGVLQKDLKGSILWMAPEILMMKPVGRRSDIWSLGCTLIELATAQHPWSDITEIGQLFMSLGNRETPKIPGHLSHEAQSFIRRCLTFDKDDRPTASRLLEDPFVSSPGDMSPLPGPRQLGRNSAMEQASFAPAPRAK